MTWYWNPLGLAGLLSGAAAFTAAGFVLFTRPGSVQNRALAAMIAVSGVAMTMGGGIMYLTTDQRLAHAAQIVAYVVSAAGPWLYLRFLGTLRVRSTAWLTPRVRAALIPVALAFAAFVMLRPELFVTGVEPTTYSRWESIHGAWSLAMTAPIMVAAAYGLVVAIEYWRSAPLGSARRRAGATYALAFACTDSASLIFLTVAFVIPGSSDAAVVGVSILLVALQLAFYTLLAYGMLRHQLFGLDLKIKWTIRRGAVVGIFLAVFFVVSVTAENYLTDRYGWAFGGAAAGLLLFGIAPLQRLGDRVANRAMPAVDDSASYRSFRALQVYEATYEELSPGGITAKERRALEALRARLDISTLDAKRLEQAAAARGA